MENKKKFIFVYLFNILIPGGGFAWFYGLPAAVIFNLSIFIFSAFGISIWAYSNVKFGTFSPIIVSLGLVFILFLQFLLMKQFQPNSITSKPKRFMTLILSLLIYIIFAFFGNKLTQHYFIWFIKSDNQKWQEVIPLGQCGYINRIHNTLNLNDPVAYTHKIANNEIILLGIIKALPEQQYLPRDSEMIIIPRDHYFIDSESKESSLDSNIIGPIRSSNILGRISEVVSKEKFWSHFLSVIPRSCD